MEKLPQTIYENGIEYALAGDYYIPMLTLPQESRPIGRWGQMHRAYLEEHRHGRYASLLLTGKLWTYLADLNEQAQERLDCITAQMKAAEGVTEELKACDRMEWGERAPVALKLRTDRAGRRDRRCNSIRSRAEEIIRSELIYV